MLLTNAITVRVIATMMTSARAAFFVGKEIQMITLSERTSRMDVLGLPLMATQIIVYPLTGMPEH
jgi:hypothetical protein